VIVEAAAHPSDADLSLDDDPLLIKRDVVLAVSFDHTGLITTAQVLG
jgi:hypothetical protein